MHGEVSHSYLAVGQLERLGPTAPTAIQAAPLCVRTAKPSREAPLAGGGVLQHHFRSPARVALPIPCSAPCGPKRGGPNLTTPVSDRRAQDSTAGDQVVVLGAVTKQASRLSDPTLTPTWVRALAVGGCLHAGEAEEGGRWAAAYMVCMAHSAAALGGTGPHALGGTGLHMLIGTLVLNVGQHRTAEFGASYVTALWLALDSAPLATLRIRVRVKRQSRSRSQRVTGSGPSRGMPVPRFASTY
eukprot:350653-Chlamydomonas_euryale.AAC.7